MERKKALITGASRGIGKAIAQAFARSGYDLYLTCHTNIALLEEIGRELEKEYQVSCKCYCFPISEEKSVIEMYQSIGTLDVLVNNAGISYIGLLADMSYGDWKKIIDTNLGGCFLTCRYAVPGMVSRKKGKIINISSVWGRVGASMEVAYSASKGGINAFTKALAKELGPSNIQVNAIACGIIDTDMNKCFDEEELGVLIQEIPMDRLGKPQEVANLVLQLCEGNEYLTGQVITLDGGWL
ncbi:MAG: SDR family NAD(P)-dependent oxidoreductase [Lachnospiraceae bacterium]|nr:SDR family NAD(P)-dependent oxidoreductase [Lachnospiraceae bacterium]MBQ6996364.1 SDR family NAD(P)-dependent oxidoreductase [Lachnospiraceae bacterium]